MTAHSGTPQVSRSAPGSFEYRFDPYDPSYCLAMAEYHLELRPPLGTALRASGIDEVVATLEAFAASAELDDGTRRVAADVADSLRHCAEHRCDCVDFDHERDLVDDLLAGLDDTLWALRRIGEPAGELAGTPSLERLFAAVGVSRYGFDEVWLRWDGSSLTAGFAGYPWGRAEVLATPLDAARLALHEHWCWDDEDAAWVLTELDDAAVEALGAAELAEHDHGCCLCRLARACVQLAPDDELRALLVGLAADWGGTTDELVEASVALATAR